MSINTNCELDINIPISKIIKRLEGIKIGKAVSTIEINQKRTKNC